MTNDHNPDAVASDVPDVNHGSAEERSDRPMQLRTGDVVSRTDKPWLDFRPVAEVWWTEQGEMITLALRSTGTTIGPFPSNQYTLVRTAEEQACDACYLQRTTGKRCTLRHRRAK